MCSARKFIIHRSYAAAPFGSSLKDDHLLLFEYLLYKGVTMHWDNVFGNVDYLLDYVIRQVHLKFICVFSALESILHL